VLSSVVLMVIDDGMGVVGSRGSCTLDSSLGGTVGNEFSDAVSSLASSGIWVGGETMDADKFDADSDLVDHVASRDWHMCPFCCFLAFR